MKRIGVVLLTMFTAASAWSGDAAVQRKALDGTWTPISAEVAGVKFPDSELKKITLKIDGETYVVQIDKVIDKGTVKTDATKKPKSLDIVGTEGPNKGKTMLAIYELDKDMLRVCYDVQGKNRPTEFVTSKEKPFFLAVYKRAK